VDLVFDAKRFSFRTRLPMFLRDDAMGLRQAFGRQRVRTEISGQALNRELGKFFVRTLRVDDILIAKFCEALEEIH